MLKVQSEDSKKRVASQNESARSGMSRCHNGGPSMLFLTGIFLVLLTLIVERYLVSRWRRSVPVRIHVHGTRGKSTATHMLASLLREAGHVVLSKTTGDRPEYEFPDGGIRPVRRLGPPRIQEHISTLRLAARLKATAIVVEGMALQGETLFASEKMLRATHAVITNVRPDHAESMGEGRAGVAATLSLMLPPQRPVFTSAEDGADEVQSHVQEAGGVCYLVKSEAGVALPSQGGRTEDLLRQPERLARAIMKHLHPFPNGEEMKHCHLDLPEGQTPRPIPVKVGEVEFVWLDLFSVNDVDSARLLLDTLWDSLPQKSWCAALVATRQDRPLRTVAFMDWLKHEPLFSVLAPAGSHAWAAWSRAPKRSLWLSNPLCAPSALLDKLERARQKENQPVSPLLVVGFGNSHGYGERWRTMISQARNTVYAG